MPPNVATRALRSNTPWEYHGAVVSLPRGPTRRREEPRVPAANPPRRGAAPAPEPPNFRHSYSKDKAGLIRRLSRMEGQVRGIARMIEREEYCVDILQQTAALRAAVDAVSVLVLEDHVQGCVRTAAERGEADAYVDEVIDVVRRTLGRPIRGGTRA
jgi:DNA-binding FrmR family transcriptional regulator